MRRVLAALALALAVLVSGAALPSDEASDPPEWTDDLKFVVFGGPSHVDIEVSINGEFTALIQEGAPPSSEIADLLRPGINEMTLGFTIPEAVRENANRLKVAVAHVKRLTAHQRQVQEPLAEVTIPDDFSPEEPCELTLQFWGGPPKTEQVKPLKERYWLFITGPPVHHCVRVLANGVPLADASAGDSMVEVTEHLLKGKNEIVFEGRPTCLFGESGREGPLTFSIGPAELEREVVRMTEAPLVVFEIDDRRPREPFTKKMAFRAW